MAQLSRPQKERILAIAQNFGALDVKLFGSMARGTASARSDLDLLVRFERKATLLTVIGFQQAVEEALGTKIDVVEEGGLSPFMAERILSEAIAL